MFAIQPMNLFMYRPFDWPKTQIARTCSLCFFCVFLFFSFYFECNQTIWTDANQRRNCGTATETENHCQCTVKLKAFTAHTMQSNINKNVAIECRRNVWQLDSHDIDIDIDMKRNERANSLSENFSSGEWPHNHRLALT